MLSHELEAEINSITQLYKTAVYSGATLSNQARESAVIEFQERTSQFELTSSLDWEALETRLKIADVYQQNAIARLLISGSDEERLKSISTAIAKNEVRTLSDNTLRLLWQIVPPTISEFEKVMNMGASQRFPMLKALLSKPSHEAHELFDKVMSGHDNHLKIHALEAVVEWKDVQILADVLSNVSHNQVPQNVWDADVYVNVVFHLGLLGDMSAIKLLEQEATSNPTIRSAFACVRLAWLALPACINPIDALLQSSNTELVNLGLDAASIIRSGGLLPSLIKLSEIDIGSNLTPIAENASIILTNIFGYNPRDNGYDFSQATTEEDTTKHPPSYYSNILKQPNPSKRYYEGKLLTLENLVSDLLSPHQGAVQASIYNLRAITGETYNYRFDGDLIMNLQSIHAWRQKVSTCDYFEAGGWAFYGKPLPNTANQ